MSKFIKLAKIADVITGFPFKGDQYSDSGIRTVRGENVTEGSLRWDTIKCWDQEFEKEEDYLLKVDDVVIGMDGSKVGKNKARVKENDLPLLLAQRVACVRAKKGNDQVFLYYLINNPRFERYVFQTQTGSSVPHISKSQIEEYEVPDFDYLSQQKIASVLSALDDKIELNNRINAELEAMAKLVYEYWFVQFDFPNQDGKPFKSSGGKMVWNEELKREVPEGWRSGTLKEVIELNYGKPLKSEERTGEGFPVVGSGGIVGYHNEALVKGPGIVVGRKGTVGSITFLHDDFYPIDTSYYVVPKNNQQIYYFYFLLKSLGLEKMNSDSAVPGLNRERALGTDIGICDQELINKFNLHVYPTFEKIKNIQKQNQELSTLRDWLLPMLMNGQVTVDKLSHHDGLGDLKEELGMVAEREREKYGEK